MNTPNVIWALDRINLFLEDISSPWQGLDINRFESIIFSEEKEDLINGQHTCHERIDTSSYCVDNEKYNLYNNYYILLGFQLRHHHKRKHGPNMGLVIYVQKKDN